MRSASLAFLFALSLVSPALAGQDVRFYGPQGQYQGRASTNTANPRQQSIYDASGRYQGRIMTSPDGSQRAYDSHGRYLGRATGWPQPTQEPKK